MIRSINGNLYNYADVSRETGVGYPHVHYMCHVAKHCTQPTIKYGTRMYYDDESFRKVCNELTRA